MLNIITSTIWLLASRLTVLRAKFERLARVAVKLGLPAPTIEVLAEENRPTRDGLAAHWLQILVTGCAPVVAGWRFVGVLQHLDVDGQAENILRAVPGVELPSEFRHRAAWCDHCRTSRNRIDTYLVQNVESGEIKQVGSTCLRDFTGHDDPHALAEFVAQWLDSVDEAQREDDEFGGCGRETSRFSLTLVLEYTVQVIAACGWLSRSKARDEGGVATADVVEGMFFPPLSQSIREFHAKVFAQSVDSEFVESALAWARGLTWEQTADSDYLHNLRVVASQEYIDSRLLGIACSLIPAYQRHLEQLSEAASKPESHHVGTIKAKLSLSVIYDRSVSFCGQYGPGYFHFFHDAAGNVLKWSTGEDLMNLKPGDTLKLSGTVKAHDSYKGVAQTCVTRCKVAVA